MQKNPKENGSPLLRKITNQKLKKKYIKWFTFFRHLANLIRNIFDFFKMHFNVVLFQCQTVDQSKLMTSKSWLKRTCQSYNSYLYTLI